MSRDSKSYWVSLVLKERLRNMEKIKRAKAWEKDTGFTGCQLYVINCAKDKIAECDNLLKIIN